MEQIDPTVDLTTEQVIQKALELEDVPMLISTPITEFLSLSLYVTTDILTEVIPSLHIERDGTHAAFRTSEEGPYVDGGTVPDPVASESMGIEVGKIVTMPIRLNIHDVIDLFRLSDPLWSIDQQ